MYIRICTFSGKRDVNVRKVLTATFAITRADHDLSVSIKIYRLDNGVHRRSPGALTTLMGLLPRVFYVYHDCTATSRRFYYVITATIKAGQIFGNFISEKDDAEATRGLD